MLYKHSQFQVYTHYHCRRWKYRDLEIWVTCHSKPLKMIPFERFSTVSYVHSMVR